ncbi:MAG: green heme protein [Cycloclasticus sp.]|nr:MAG: green heme protein [Cycloclasticus sp.]
MKNLLFVVSVYFLLSPIAYAADIDNGRTLHAENCLACHTTDKYTSKLRKVHDLAALTRRVKRCDFSLGTQWFDDDIADVVTYLNKDFYQFK